MDTSHQPAGVEGGGGPEKLRLKVASGNAAGTVIEVEDELVIGRQAAGHGSLGNDIEISRQHARITRDADGRYLIEDLNSTNGTYVNGRLVDGPTSLETGDRIEVGASALIVQVSAPPPTPRSTPVTTTSAQAQAQAEADPLEPTGGAGPAPPVEAAAGAIGGVEVAGVEAAGLPRLGLRIEVDAEAREVIVALDEGGGEARFVHEGGAWRVKRPDA